MRVTTFDLEEKTSLKTQCWSPKSQRLPCGPAFRLDVAGWWSTEVWCLDNPILVQIKFFKCFKLAANS